KLTPKEKEKWRRGRRRYFNRLEKLDERWRDLDEKYRTKLQPGKVKGGVGIGGVGECPSKPVELQAGVFAEAIAGVWVVAVKTEWQYMWKWLFDIAGCEYQGGGADQKTRVLF